MHGCCPALATGHCFAIPFCLLFWLLLLSLLLLLLLLLLPTAQKYQHLFTVKSTGKATLPPDLLVSHNYFNLHWSGYRRVKNPVMVVDWCAQASKRSEQRILQEPNRKPLERCLQRVWKLFGLQEAHSVDASKARMVLDAAGLIQQKLPDASVDITRLKVATTMTTTTATIAVITSNNSSCGHYQQQLLLLL